MPTVTKGEQGSAPVIQADLHVHRVFKLSLDVAKLDGKIPAGCDYRAASLS